MKHMSAILALSAAGVLAGCNDPNTVLFVTNSSLGINFDSKPATANIAYDRVEGFIGPRYPNGGAPPAVASMETGGNIFNPMVRQTYATGAAAIGATSGTVPLDAPQGMEGPSDQKKLMFFGTATTFGLKIGFAVAGTPVPDSFLFGYRRKEASIIPIAEKQVDGKPEGTVKAVYPSVLASMEVNVASTPDNPKPTGIDSTQFFATGPAAEALSTNPKVRAAFLVKAEKAALAGLTSDEQKAANVKAAQFLQTHTDHLNGIVTYLTKDGAFTNAKLKALIAKAQAAGGKVPDFVGDAKTDEELKQKLRRAPTVVDTLYNATQS